MLPFGSDEKAPTQENEHKMQIARVLKCVGECGDEHATLYYCNECDSETIYCDECGPFLHRKKNHKWKDHTMVIPNIDSNQYKFGERVIIDHIGEENYRRIAPYIHAVKSQTGVACSVSVMCFDAISKQSYALGQAQAAAEFAQRCSRISTSAREVAAELTGKKNLCDAARNNAQSIWQENNNIIENRPFSFLYEWFYAEHIKKVRLEYDEAVQLADAAQTSLENASKAAKTASDYADQCANLAKEQLIKAEKATKAVQEATSIKQSAVNSACWAVGFVVIEMAWNGYKLGCNEITANEWRRLTAKSIGRNAISSCVGIIGTQIGVGTAYGLSQVFGNNVFSKLGGHGVGLIAGIIASSFSGKCFEEWFEARWPSEKKAQRQKLIDEALKYFHFSMDEITDSDRFNVNTIQRKYRKYALEAHPDRNRGDILKWEELSVYYGILMGLFDANKKTEIPSLDQ